MKKLFCLVIFNSWLFFPASTISATTFEVKAKTGDSSIGTSGSLQSVASTISINDTGVVAFSATFDSGGTSYSGVFRQSPDQIPELLSGGLSSSFRIFSFTQVNNSGVVVSRDAISASFFIRRWNGTVPSTVAKTGDSGPLGTLDAVNLPSIANDGAISFVGLISTFSSLYVADGSLDDLHTFSAGSGGLRPLLADGKQVVVRNGTASTGSIRVYRDGPTTLLASPPQFGELGAASGITDAGDLAAFAASDANGAGIFAYDFRSVGVTAPQPVRWISVASDAANEIATVRGIGTGFDRVGVEKISSFFGNQIRLTFLGTNDSGNTALYAARVDRSSGKVFGLTPVVSVGGNIHTSSGAVGPISGLSLYDPVNNKGQIAFGFNAGTLTGAAVYSGMNFTKYKQFADNTPLNSDPLTRWFDEPIHPTIAGVANFERSGCFITSFATVSGFFGQEMTPLRMRDSLAQQGLLSGSGINIDGLVSSGVPFVQDGLKAIGVKSRGGNFASLVAELKSDLPVMLAVPDSSHITNGTGQNLHAIVAYDINPDLGPMDPVAASDIYISDPGHGSFYATRYGVNEYTRGEELVHVTLQDYFDLASGTGGDASHPFSFDPQTWFDLGTFIRDSDSSTFTLTTQQQNRDMTFFETIQGPLAPISQVVVQSPVDLILTEPVSGQRYVSSPSLTMPGDILLDKTLFDTPGVVSDDDSIFDEGENELFPAYSLALPSSLVGLNLNVEIVGIGDGTFTVSLFTGDPGLVPSNPLTGSILNGESQFGVLGVEKSLLGDYNGNGNIDAADYTVWRNNLGSDMSLTNDDTPGVGQDDYDRWKMNFGQVVGSASNASENTRVPEPSTLVMLMMAVTGWRFRRGWAAQHVSETRQGVTPVKN